MPLQVVNRVGEVTPFSTDRVVGSLVKGGLDGPTAIARANTVQTVAQASGVSTVSTDAIRGALGELAINPSPPDVSRISSIVTSAPPGLSDSDSQDHYTLAVLSLIHVASEIHAGKGNQLASRIERALATHLTDISSFPSSPYTTLALQQAGLLYQQIGQVPPAALEAKITAAAAAAEHVLSDGCFAETFCDGGSGCHRWPTSLPDIDTSKPDPMGWRYIIDSHCGFHWPRFWKMDCGQPKGLEACTG